MIPLDLNKANQKYQTNALFQRLTDGFVMLLEHRSHLPSVALSDIYEALELARYKHDIDIARQQDEEAFARRNETKDEIVNGPIVEDGKIVRTWTLELERRMKSWFTPATKQTNEQKDVE